MGLTDDSNVYDWEILIMGPDGTLYEGGFFKARLVFPKDFPNKPPKMTFQSEMWHPNIYENGEVCISILHDLPPLLGGKVVVARILHGRGRGYG